MARKRAGKRLFGTVHRTKAKDGTRVYIARWRERGKRRKRWFASATLANRFLGKRAGELAQESALGIRAVTPIKFREFVERFPSLFAGRKAHATLLREHAYLTAHAVPFFGTLQMHAVLRDDVEKWLNKRVTEDGIGAATRNRLLGVLSSCFRLAVSLNYARENPCRGIARSPEAKREPPYLSFADQERLIAECPAGGLREFVTVLLDSGIRCGEALRLTWRDVDSERNVLTVRESKNREPRIVPMPSRARAVLSAMRLAADPQRVPGYVFGNLRTLNASEEPILLPSLRREWGRIRKRVKFPDLRVHDLRHSYGTMMARAGVPVGDLQRLMGHKTASVCLRYSAHAPSNYGDLALARFEALASAERSAAKDRPAAAVAT